MNFRDMTPDQRRAYLAVWNTHGHNTGKKIAALSRDRLDEIAKRAAKVEASRHNAAKGGDREQA
jgi:hypothetical protein